MQIGRLPFPTSMEIRVPYVEDFNIQADAVLSTAAVQYSFFLNNMYDPRTQVGGHQPFQYDQLAAIYTNYHVHDAYVKITFRDTSTDGAMVGYRVRNYNNFVGASGQDISYLSEMSYGDMQPLNNTGEQLREFKFHVNIADILGIPRIASTTENNLQGRFDGSVVPNWWVMVEPFMLSTHGTSVTNCRCKVEIWYAARVGGYLTVAQS